MSFESVLIAMFAIAAAVALLAHRLKIPYTVALVIAGVALGATHSLSPPHLTKDLLYSVFLPGLLFEAAFNLQFKRFWSNVLAIGGLTVPGLVLSALLVAALVEVAVTRLHFVAGFTFVQALVFASLIGATDPIAVVALFRALGVPRRLATLVEGESLFNDGTAVAFYTVVLTLQTGAHPSMLGAIGAFAKIGGLGLVVGCVFGLGVSRIIRHVDDAMIEITLTTIAAYGSFVAADAMHASGVIATVTAGMLCGNYAAPVGMSAATRLAATSFWEYVAFALNSLVFLLIGFEVSVDRLWGSWRVILVAYAVVTAVRALLVFSIAAVLYPTRERIPWSWGAVLGWGGLRGALSMVLALSLPWDLAARDLIVTMTFGVVLISILVQGLTMKPMLRALKVGVTRDDDGIVERARAEAFATRAALDALRTMDPGALPDDATVSSIKREYEARLRGATEKFAANAGATPTAGPRDLRRRLLLAEKDALVDAHRRGLVSRERVDTLLRDCDERLLSLDQDT